MCIADQPETVCLSFQDNSRVKHPPSSSKPSMLAKWEGKVFFHLHETLTNNKGMGVGGEMPAICWLLCSFLKVKECFVSQASWRDGRWARVLPRGTNIWQTSQWNCWHLDIFLFIWYQSCKWHLCRVGKKQSSLSERLTVGKITCSLKSFPSKYPCIYWYYLTTTCNWIPKCVKNWFVKLSSSLWNCPGAFKYL